MYEKYSSTMQLNARGTLNPDIDDKLDGLNKDGSNVIEIFYRNYRDWIIFINKNFYHRAQLGQVVDKIDKLIKNGQPAYCTLENGKSMLLQFANAEIKLFNASVQLVLEIQQKEYWKFYINHIKTNLGRYEKIDLTSGYLDPNSKSPPFKTYAKDKISETDIDLNAMSLELRNLILKADMLYWMNELDDIHTIPFDTYENLEENLSRYFNFEDYKNPFELQEFPEAKVIYLKTLKTWLLIQIKNRKTALDFDLLPPPYAFIEKYALSLTETTPPVRTPQVFNESITLNIGSTVNNDFPFRIFSSRSAYDLFVELVKGQKTHSFVSFVYRTMSEKEKPPIIVCKDTEFRNWFNSDYPGFELVSYTKIYDKVKSKDRVLLYETVKRLIIKDS